VSAHSSFSVFQVSKQIGASTERQAGADLGKQAPMQSNSE
jgi:hypothetical protein